MTRLYKVTYEICGCVDACLVRASSNTAQSNAFTRYTPARILSVLKRLTNIITRSDTDG